jgi:hypothetical protein
MLQDQHPAPRPSDPDDTNISVAVADKIMEVLLAFEGRLDRIEAAVRGG